MRERWYACQATISYEQVEINSVFNLMVTIHLLNFPRICMIIFFVVLHCVIMCIFQEIIPIIIWEKKTFSTAVLALIIFGSLILFPAILIPSTPSMWVAGMTFGYGYGFLLVMAAIPLGVTIPFFIGSLFYHRIEVSAFSCFHRSMCSQ